MRFDPWSVVFLCRPTNGPSLSEGESAALQDEHLAYLARQRDTGQLLAAGPARGASYPDLAGICIYAVGPDEARRIAEEDPAVKAGELRVELVTWTVPGDSLRPGPGHFPRSMRDVDAP